MLATVLDRCVRRCSDANDHIAMMQAQNDAQRAEINDLKERVQRLESSNLPPVVAPQRHVDRRPHAPPSVHQLQPLRVHDAYEDGATIENGRLVQMRAGERAKEFWTVRRADTAHGVPSSLNRHGADQAPARGRPPDQRLRRPGSPRPTPFKRAVTSPLDAPPMPVRPETALRTTIPRGP